MLKKVLLFSLSVLILSCSSEKENADNISNNLTTFTNKNDNIILDTNLGEKLADNEANLTNIIENTIIESLKKEYPSGIVKRDAHAKHHGCVKASFKINNSAVNDKFKVGVFSENNKEYKAWIRFSNGSKNNDTEKDVRGFAIKLMGVEGAKLLNEESNEKTQDFLMINNSAMFINDLNAYIDLVKATSGGSIAQFALKHPVIAYKILQATSKKVDSPLNSDYFSTTPYKLGNTAIKFKVKPCSTSTAKPDNSSDFLRKELSKSLKQKDACFDFQIQERKGTFNDMPIEDSTVDWSTSNSPYITIARITIPKQDFESPEQMSFCENMSYTPWHSLPEHKPLGSLNRVRKQVYTAISKFRHSKNNQVRKEPVDFNF
ncbi:MAG: catalase family protein [Candidatus Sericytochromatia bacterium]